MLILPLSNKATYELRSGYSLPLQQTSMLIGLVDFSKWWYYCRIVPTWISVSPLWSGLLCRPRDIQFITPIALAKRSIIDRFLSVDYYF
jgi:hypothetical protein